MPRLSYLAKGAFSGAVATVPMSILMLLAQRAGYLGELPPERVTRQQMKAVEAGPPPGDHDFLSSVNHFAFGSVCGTLYAALRQPGPRTAPDVIGGVAFGLAVWLVSYEGWLPKLGILPKVQWDRPGRPESMAAAHVVFGATLAALLRRLGA